MADDFDKIQLNKCRLFINKNFRNSNLERALSGGEKKLQDRYQLTAVFSSDTARVYEFPVTFDGVDKKVYFKQYLYRSALDFI